MSTPVLIIGEVLADVFPEQTIIGGAPYNVARHLRAFGFSPIMLTKIGEDQYGAQILREMTTSGLETLGVQRDNKHPTGQVQVSFTPQGHQFEILNNQAYDFLDEKSALQILDSQMPSMLYLGSLALRNTQTRAVAKRVVEKVNCPIFCDINLRAPWYSTEVIEWLLSIADTVKINHEELATIAAMLNIVGDAQEQAWSILKKYPLHNLLVTHGEAGSWWLKQDGKINKVGQTLLARPLIDTVGAGDAYSAVAIMALLNAWETEKTLQRVSDFATAICTVRGAVPVDKSFYTPFLENWFGGKNA
jgi:fructokinase